MALANSTGVIGVNTERSTPNAEFAAGTDVLANGTSYTYAKASDAIAAAATRTLSGAFGATVTAAGSTHTHDLTTTIPAGEYFWAKLVTSAV